MNNLKSTQQSTAHELQFLNNVLTNENNCRCSTERKINVLKGYIESIPKRTNWIGMDKAEILAHAEKLLLEI